MLQNKESEVSSSCYVCHQTESTDEKGQLKKLSESTWATVKRVAALRKSLKSDKYSEVTQTISVSSVHETSDLSYHPYCHKSYTAVKRVKDTPLDDEPEIKIACTETRHASAIPKSNKQGMLKGLAFSAVKVEKRGMGKKSSC